MKNDLDFIKDKFNNCDVNAPENMDENFILDKISEAEQKESKRKGYFRGYSIAAAIAAFTLIAFAATSIIGNAPKPITISGPIGENIEMVSFKSRGEVKSALKEIYNNRSVDYNGYDAAALSVYDPAFSDMAGFSYKSSAGSPAGIDTDIGHNSTYTQDIAVDEADTVKTDGRYIYYQTDYYDRIEIFTAEGKKSKKISEIEIGTNNEQDAAVTSFYIYRDKLIALEDVEIYNKKTDSYSDNTRAEIYDISDIKHIKLIDSFDQSGYYCSSRMIGGMLYVVSTQYAYNEDELPYTCYNKATSDEATPEEVPANEIYSVENPSDADFLVVSSIDTEKSAQATKTKAILGSASEVYCNEDFLYVTAAEYNYVRNYVYEDVDYNENSFGDAVKFNSSASYAVSEETTQIVKISLEKDIDFVASTRVKGYIDNQYSLDEKDGCLRVATTTSSTDGKYIQSNNLFILDKNLKKVGEVTGFAKDESIKAVRYVNDTAYVITYEETDPLFIIDLSDVKKPKILGEVKISGFSTLLIPIDDNTLLGIGYHTQDEDDDIDMEIEEGVKLVTFDVSDKSNPKVLDTKIYKDCESEVQNNPKALLVNFERNDFTIPLNYEDYDYEDYNPDNDKSTYGILNFKVKNGKIKIIDRYNSKKLHNYVDRCVYVGDYIYMFSSDTGNYSVAIDCVEYK